MFSVLTMKGLLPDGKVIIDKNNYVKSDVIEICNERFDVKKIYVWKYCGSGISVKINKKECGAYLSYSPYQLKISGEECTFAPWTVRDFFYD